MHMKKMNIMHYFFPPYVSYVYILTSINMWYRILILPFNYALVLKYNIFTFP